MFGSIFNEDNNSKRPAKRSSEPIFNLIETQQFIKSSFNPREVYELLEMTTKKYLVGDIGKYQLDEIQDTVTEQLRLIETLRKSINHS